MKPAFLISLGALAVLVAACGESPSNGTGGAGGGTTTATGTGGAATTTTATGTGGAGGADTTTTTTTTGTGGSGGGTTTTTGTGGSGGGSAACVTDGASNLPGVTIEFPNQPCVFTLSEVQMGIQVHYKVVVAKPVSDVIPLPQDGGGCGQPGSSGLILFEKLGGGGQNYCICDLGKCAGPSMTPVDLPVGTQEATFAWDGRNWNGPSDFGAPKGAPFPPGTYTLVVSAIGTRAQDNQPFEVKGTFDVTLVP